MPEGMGWTPPEFFEKEEAEEEKGHEPEVEKPKPEQASEAGPSEKVGEEKPEKETAGAVEAAEGRTEKMEWTNEEIREAIERFWRTILKNEAEMKQRTKEALEKAEAEEQERARIEQELKEIEEQKRAKEEAKRKYEEQLKEWVKRSWEYLLETRAEKASVLFDEFSTWAQSLSEE